MPSRAPGLGVELRQSREARHSRRISERFIWNKRQNRSCSSQLKRKITCKAEEEKSEKIEVRNEKRVIIIGTQKINRLKRLTMGNSIAINMKTYKKCIISWQNIYY